MPETLEAPTETATQEPLGDAGSAFTAALAKLQNKTAEPATDDDPAPEKAPEPEKVAKPVKAEKKAAPVDALDAALGGEPEKKPGAEETEPVLDDDLKDIENVAKGDMRKNLIRLKEMVRSERVAKEALSRVNAKLALEQKIVQDPELARQFEETKSENAKLRDAITALNVEYDPSFQEKFVAGKNRLVDKAVSRVKEFGGDHEAFKEALSLTGKNRTAAIREALSEVDDFDRPRVMAVLEQITQLEDERSELQKDPQHSWEKMQRDRVESEKKQHDEAERIRTIEFDRIATELPTKSPFLRNINQDAPGASDWNRRIAEEDSVARRAFTPEATHQEIVTLAKKGAAYDRVEEIALSERTQRKELEKKLAEYEGGTPNVRGSRKPDGKVDPLDESPGAIYTRSMEEARNRHE